MKATNTIDDYIAGFPDETQELLQQVRRTIRRAAPQAGEKISYGMPTFTINGRYLIYFAGYKKHISIYPVPRQAKEFRKELGQYEGGKGTVRFPLDKRIPFDLITRIVAFRMKEDRNKARNTSTRTIDAGTH